MLKDTQCPLWLFFLYSSLVKIIFFHFLWFFSICVMPNLNLSRMSISYALLVEIIEKIGCSKSVRLSTLIYVVYNGLALSTIFLNHFESESIYQDRPFKKCFFRWDTKKMLYIQNLWTIPLMNRLFKHYSYKSISFIQ